MEERAKEAFGSKAGGTCRFSSRLVGNLPATAISMRGTSISPRPFQYTIASPSVVSPESDEPHPRPVSLSDPHTSNNEAARLVERSEWDGAKGSTRGGDAHRPCIRQRGRPS